MNNFCFLLPSPLRSSRRRKHATTTMDYPSWLCVRKAYTREEACGKGCAGEGGEGLPCIPSWPRLSYHSATRTAGSIEILVPFSHQAFARFLRSAIRKPQAGR
eukprot:scaffold1023_cov313-Pinguiococcus_pyrenoidosus.AAC.24